MVDQELNYMITSSLNSNISIVKEVLGQEYKFRQAAASELDEILLKLKTLNAEEDTEKLKNAILARLNMDLHLIMQLNEQLLNYVPEVNITWQLKTNKMQEAIIGGIEFISGNFNSLLKSIENHGEVEGYSYKSTLPDVTVLGNKQTIYGSSKGTFLKTALIASYLTQEKKLHLSDISLSSSTQKCWLDQSAIVHVVQLPKDFEPQAFSASSYFYSDAITPKGLSYVHSGYAFGGHRDEPRFSYPTGKLFGPEDCSSWIGKVTCKTDALSTSDLIKRYRCYTDTYHSLVSAQWLETNTGKSLLQNVEPVKVRDPQRDIKPGQIYAHRFFKQGKDLSEGSGGHTALVLGTRTNGNVVTIGYNRDMPKKEGFGIEEFPYDGGEANDQLEVMYFALKR